MEEEDEHFLNCVLISAISIMMTHDLWLLQSHSVLELLRVNWEKTVFVFTQDQVKLEKYYPLIIMWSKISNMKIYDSQLQAIFRAEDGDYLL